MNPFFKNSLFSIKNLNTRISNVGIKSDDSMIEQKRIRILNSASIYGSIIFFIYYIGLFFFPFNHLDQMNLLFGATTLLVYVLSYYRKFTFSRIVALTIVPLNLLFFPLFVGKIGAEYYLILILIVGFYIVDKKPMLVLLSIYIILLFILSKYFVQIRIYPEPFQTTEQVIYYCNLAFFLLLLMLISLIFKSDTLKYQAIIEAQEQTLSQKIVELENSKSLLEQLIKELNHRVKNNLQMISSLFNIQSYKTKNKETKSALKDARNRIVSIAIMHQKLYKDNLFYEVQLKSYIEELVDYLIQSVADDENVNVVLNIADLTLRIEETVHVGLLINELLTNALKYGSNANNQNQIRIDIFYNNPCLFISVADTGAGFPENFSIESTDSFGLDLVKNIVNQHEGNFQFKNLDGAKIELQLKIPEISD